MPQSMEELDAYAAEIRVDLGNGQWRRGSGYVIGPCRILTALHVLIGQDAIERRGTRITLPGSIDVRAHGDFEARFGRPDVVLDRAFDRVRAAAAGDYLWRPARLIWPDEQAEVPRFELAVLEVAPHDALPHVRDAKQVSCSKPDADVSCRGTGFAKWMELQTPDGVDLSNPGTITGILTASAERYRSFRPFTVQNGAPQNDQEWMGLSGAAFFDVESRALVGLASEVRRVSGNSGLWLTRIADLADGTEFQGFWTACGLSRPGRSGGIPLPRFRVDPRIYIHHFDREPQLDKVVDAFDPPSTEPKDPDEPHAPPIFLISGRRRDLPDAMVLRIREQIAPEFIGIRAGKPIQLAWRYGEDAARGVVGLQRDIARGLNAKSLLRVNDLSALSEHAKGQDWSLDIDVSRTSDLDLQALSQFLATFATFEPSDRPPALYVNFTAGESEKLAEEDAVIQDFLNLLKQINSSFSHRTLVVEEIYLNNCAFSDIKNWSESISDYCLDTADEIRNYLEKLFRNVPFYPLEDIKNCLSSES
jgi:hypothetical protein